MPRTLSLLAALCLAVSAAHLSAQAMEHHHHHDEAPENETLGQVSFPTSCSAAAQPAIVHGVALLHSFGYAKAQMQFESIAKSDPTCAIAHWGIAMTQYKELWGEPDADALKLGADETAKARALDASATPRERAYIDALSAFFAPAPDFQHRADAYEAGMNALHAAFPDDIEGSAFDALAILASTNPTDTSLTHERQGLAILLPLFAAHPDHPGLAHYIIHTCDTPALAPQALDAARVYAKIAPSSPHALHMPAHIFARLGMWPEDIQSNLASVAASEKAEADHEPGAAHQMHADEFLIYAYLQTGEDEKARALNAQMNALGNQMAAMPGMDDMKNDGHFFTNELNAVYLMEMHDWPALAAAQPAPGSPAYETYLTYWGQAVAAGHMHDPRLVASILPLFDKSFESLRHSEFASYAPRLEIIRNEMLAWQAFADDHPDAAEIAMRRAADQQDKMGQGEVDIPAREMLGDLLLMEGRPADALTAYRVALKLSPNRLNGLLGAGAAAEQSGLTDEARAYYKRAADQTNLAAHSTRPDLRRAVKLATTETASTTTH